MKKTLLLLVCLGVSLSPAQTATPTFHLVPAKVGLVLLGAAHDGFAIATDGASLNADGRVSQEQKLLQAGKQAALAIFGTVSVQDPVGRPVREEVNISRTAAAWLAAHPDADLQTISREANSAVLAAVNQFFATRDPGAAHGEFKFGIVVAGLSQGNPMVITTRYFLPAAKGKALRTEQTSTVARPGNVWLFGNSSAAKGLLAGSSSALAPFRTEDAVRKFHVERQKSGAMDMAAAFQVIVRAAESDDGKKLDGKRAIVAPPERIATITLKEGFNWRQAAQTR